MCLLASQRTAAPIAGAFVSLKESLLECCPTSMLTLAITFPLGRQVRTPSIPGTKRCEMLDDNSPTRFVSRGSV